MFLIFVLHKITFHLFHGRQYHFCALRKQFFRCSIAVGHADALHVEFGGTEGVFSMPKDKRTEAYITGRFG